VSQQLIAQAVPQNGVQSLEQNINTIVPNDGPQLLFDENTPTAAIYLQGTEHHQETFIPQNTAPLLVPVYGNQNASMDNIPNEETEDVDMNQVANEHAPGNHMQGIEQDEGVGMLQVNQVATQVTPVNDVYNMQDQEMISSIAPLLAPVHQIQDSEDVQMNQVAPVTSDDNPDMENDVAPVNQTTLFYSSNMENDIAPVNEATSFYSSNVEMDGQGTTLSTEGNLITWEKCLDIIKQDQFLMNVVHEMRRLGASQETWISLFDFTLCKLRSENCGFSFEEIVSVFEIIWNTGYVPYNHNGYAPVYVFAMCNRPEILKDVLDNTPEQDNETIDLGCFDDALEQACDKGSERVVLMLLAHPLTDPKVNKCDALHFASSSGHENIVKILLNDGRVYVTDRMIDRAKTDAISDMLIAYRDSEE
jgi:hypothetical protein